MSLNCFGKRKRSKEPRFPPPSRESVDKPAPVPRDFDQDTSISHHTALPPLPDRHVEGHSAVHDRLNGTYSHSERVPISQSGGSPILESKTKPKRQSNIPIATQLPDYVLSTPVPIGGGGQVVDRPLPDPIRHEPIGQESEEDYLDPKKPPPSTPTTTAPSLSAAGRGKFKTIASISEEKKTDIFNDYFPDASILRTAVPRETASDKGLPPAPIYTNVLEYPETQQSPRLAAASNGNDFAENALKSPRRPRPVPRGKAGSENSSQKASPMTSDNEESAFAYENVKDALNDLPPTPTSNEGPVLTPRPLPRSKASTENSASSNVKEDLTLNDSLMCPVPGPDTRSFPGRSSPFMQNKTAKEGYVLEVDYVPPSDSGIPLQKSPLPSPPIDVRPQTQAPPFGNGHVDLHTAVPRATTEHGLLADGTKQGYLPMDRSPHTKAMTHPNTPHGGRPAAEDSCDLNVKVPVAKANDLHVPGYLTILSDPSKPASHSGPYYNISSQSGYINPSEPPPDRSPMRSRHPTNESMAEKIYY